MTGLLLMAISIAAFVGTTSDKLPPMTFFPALVLFGAGALKFMRTNHEALERAEKRTERALNPVIRENHHARAHAERQAARRGSSLNHSGAEDSNASRGWAGNESAASPREMIEFDDQEDDFVVATDVSFPIEIQAGDALADQLRKLNQLLEQGVLTAEEYAVAKAKLLD
jgi:hypothetical protein